MNNEGLKKEYLEIKEILKQSELMKWTIEIKNVGVEVVKNIKNVVVNNSI